MSKYEADNLGLRREGEARRRRFPWWIAALAVVIVALGLGALWLFRPRIEQAMQRPPTLPPPPPTQTAGAPSTGGQATASGGGDGPSALYQTDFGDPTTTDWQTYNDGIISAAIQDGMLVVGVDALEDRGAWSGLNYTLDDFVLDVDATKIAGPDDNGIIVVFRQTDDQNYDRFDISSDGFYALSMARNGMPMVVSDWTPSDAINKGNATNHIRVRAVGDTFSFTVNGTPLTLCVSYETGVQPIPLNGECQGGQNAQVWQNGDQPRGRIGLGAQGIVGFDGQQSTPAQATIGFDNLVISKP